MGALGEKTAKLRRQHVLDAALKVFAERGFHRTTIRDIAQAAGVSDGTIYNVFENKEALLLALLRPLEEEAPARSHNSVAPDDLDTLVRQMVRQRWASFTPEMLSMLRVVLSEVLVNSDLRSRYLELVIAPALAGAEPLFRSLVRKRPNPQGRCSDDDAAVRRLVSRSRHAAIARRRKT